MPDRTFKLNRLAMHQEWYDKNRPLLFIEASVVMQELLAMCRQYKAEHDALRAERDEARREVCGLLVACHTDPDDEKPDPNLKNVHAGIRGWDCFKENTND